MSTSGQAAFGELLKRYRQEAWLTQEALAERLRRCEPAGAFAL